MHFSTLTVCLRDGKFFFLVRMMTQRNRFPIEVKDAMSLEIFTVRLALSNLAELTMFLLIAGELRIEEIQKAFVSQTIL